MRAFADDRLQANFARDGYVVVRLMDGDRARALGAQCRDLLPADIPAHENVTYIYTDEPDLEWIERLAGPVFEEGMMPFLSDMKRLHPSVIVKPAGERAVPPHVHPIFTLDQRLPTVFCWCALEDMSEENGMMQVLPGSHKLFPIMPMYGQEPYFLKAWSSIEEKMQSVCLKAGEAMLFDESLIHASFPNATDRHRIALATHCIPAATDPIALFPAGSGQYAVYETGRDFGYQYHIRPEPIDPPDHWRMLGYVDDIHRQVGAEEFWDRLNAGRRISTAFPLVTRRARVHGPRVTQSADGWRQRARGLLKRVFQHA